MVVFFKYSAYFGIFLNLGSIFGDLYIFPVPVPPNVPHSKYIFFANLSTGLVYDLFTKLLTCSKLTFLNLSILDILGFCFNILNDVEITLSLSFK